MEEQQPAASTAMESDDNKKKNFQISEVSRNEKKPVVVSSLAELCRKAATLFEKPDKLPKIHLDADGTEVDDEEYYRTLESETDLIAVFPGEQWIDPSHCVTITTQHDQTDAADKAEKTARIKQLVGQLQNNICNVSVMSDPDLDSLSNMDPNSLVDITGKDFMDQLKDSGRPLCAKRAAEDRISLLKLLKDGAIFCSQRYPEEAEAIDAEIRRQLSDELQNHNNIQQQHQQQQEDINNKTIEQVQTTTTTTTTTNMNNKQQLQDQQTITIVVTDTNLQNDNKHTITTAEDTTTTTQTTNAGNTNNKTPDI